MTADRYNDKVVLITGAGSGIGAATAARVASEGGHVVCLDVAEDAAEKTAAAVVEAGGTALPVSADITDSRQAETAVARTLDEFGKLDTLMNIAGVGSFSHTHEETFERWQKMIDVNLNGTFIMCRLAIEPLLDTKGAIVNTGSIAGLRGQAYSAAYCASKGGVIMLTKAIAVEYATKGMRANCVCPGGVNTPLLSNFLPVEGANQKLIERGISPMKRMADPAEIAAAFAYLGSDEAGYVNGESLIIDGATLAI